MIRQLGTTTWFFTLSAADMKRPDIIARHYCKVALAALCTELTRIQDGGYTAVDPTSPGLSTPYEKPYVQS